MEDDMFCLCDESGCEPEISTGPVIAPAAQLAPRRPSRRWRLGVGISVGVHVLVAGLFYAGSDKLVRLPDLGRAPLDTQVAQAAEEEQDFMVMDIGVPAAPRALSPGAGKAPVMPTVEPPPPSTVVRSGAPDLPGGAANRAAPASAPAGGNGTDGSDEPGETGATTAFFQVATQAQSVVYVIDRSGSMGASGRLALARRELLASLERLPATARFQIIPYNRRAEPLRIAGQSGLVPATPENKRAAAALLAALVPEGSTEHQAALQQALLLGPEAVYFLTDADDLNPDQVRALTRLNHGRTAIHAIELTSMNRHAHALPLHVLARENRGEYRGVDLP